MLDNCVESAEPKTVAGRKKRRRRPVFRSRAMIAGAECDCVKPRRVARDHPSRKADLERLAARAVDARQARGQGRRVIGDYEIAGAEQGRERRAWQAPHSTAGVDNKELGGSASGTVGDNHWRPATARLAFGSAPMSHSTISWAASSGRFKAAGSASGTASAWSGVSTSLGSSERTRRRRPSPPPPRLPSGGAAQPCLTRTRPTRSRG